MGRWFVLVWMRAPLVKVWGLVEGRGFLRGVV